MSKGVTQKRFHVDDYNTTLRTFYCRNTVTTSLRITE